MASDVKSDRAKLRRQITKSGKDFDQQLFDSNDGQARGRVMQFLRETWGLHVVHNSDQYGPDLVVFEGLVPKYYVEVEVKHTWRGPTFPFPTVNLPQRKEKYSKLKLPCEYWILNSTMDHVIIIESSSLAKVIPVIVRNKYVADGEMFFQLPIEECDLFSLREMGPDGN
jgi:hypothetical protein